MWVQTLALLSAIIGVWTLDLNEPLEKDDIIEAINSAKTTWKAGRNFDPSLTKSYARNLLGLKRRPGGSLLPPLISDETEDAIELPKNFDAREQWSTCVSLQQVRDQGPCGSCWAVAAAAAFTDRFCIASKTSFNGHLAAEEVLSCCEYCGNGCKGGYDDWAWKFFQDNGIVTGGDYHSHEGCQPYTLPTCEHHTSGDRKNCSSYGDWPTPPCRQKCYNHKYGVPFSKDHHKVKSTFTISGNVKEMQQEIFKNGPLEAGFNVYEDFLSYKEGVYQHKTGSYLGGHAVKVIGWGEDNSVPYWLVANSWNSDWGDKGYFKIKRGNNECGFEEDMSGGVPDV